MYDDCWLLLLLLHLSCCVTKGKTVRAEAPYPHNKNVHYVRCGTKTPWLNDDHMIEWLSVCVLSHTNNRPAVLLLDSAHHHHTSKFLLFAQQCNISVIRIPAGTTATCQPLDVGVFGAVHQQMCQWTAEKRPTSLKTSLSIHAALAAWLRFYKAYSKTNIKKAFADACNYTM